VAYQRPQRVGFEIPQDTPEAPSITAICAEWRIVGYRRPAEHRWRYCGDLTAADFSIRYPAPAFPGGYAVAPDPAFVVRTDRLKHQRGSEPVGTLALFVRLARTR
jgi:hypothetical protein